jgi:prephenate dehydratase
MAGRLAFLGPVGTYTEEAALLYDPQAELQPYSTITAVGRAVASGETAEGVVPIENSLEGSVNFTLDLLIGQPDLYIRHEVVVPIEHYLMGRPGTNLDEIQVVFSHPQALAQCREYLERSFPYIQQMASLSTASAVSDAQSSPVPAAAIAPRRAAELNSAEIMAVGIQDVAANVTRFAVLGKTDHPPTGRDKTSICFTFGELDQPGQLWQVMGEFASRNINLGKIESRAHPTLLGPIRLLDRLRRSPGRPGHEGSHRGDFAPGQLVAGDGFIPEVDPEQLTATGPELR